MAKIKKSTKSDSSKDKKVSKSTLKAYIKEIADKSEVESDSKLQCLIAVNQILANADMVALLDEEGKDMLKHTWQNLKGSGVQLVDPPLLYGLPDDFESDELTQ